MEIVKIIVTVLEVIASLLLIAVILVQSGKQSGLSGALAGNSDSYMNKSKMGGLDKKLASATKWIALVWIFLTMILSLI
jgi:preprotein translocase subunit SecG